MRKFCCITLSVLCGLIAACATQSPAPLVKRGNVDASVKNQDNYIVKKGDTLYSIALEHNLDYRELAAANRIDDPGRIEVGQLLQLKLKPANPDVAVVRPVVAGTRLESRGLEDKTASTTAKTEAKTGEKTAYPGEPTPAPVKPAVQTTSPTAPKSEVLSEASAPVEAEEIQWLWPAVGKVVAEFNESNNKGIDIAGKVGSPVLAAAQGKVVYAGTGLRGYGKLLIVKHSPNFLSAYAHNQSLLVKQGQNVSRGQKIAEMGDSDADRVKLHFEIRHHGKPVDPLKYLPKL